MSMEPFYCFIIFYYHKKIKIINCFLALKIGLFTTENKTNLHQQKTPIGFFVTHP